MQLQQSLLFLGCQCYGIGGLFRSDHSVVSHIVYCLQTVHDKPLLCVEIE